MKPMASNFVQFPYHFKVEWRDLSLSLDARLCEQDVLVFCALYATSLYMISQVKLSDLIKNQIKVKANTFYVQCDKTDSQIVIGL